MKKKILIFANFDDFYNTRKEVVETLIINFEVIICYPYGPNVEKFKAMGCKYENIDIDRRGTNPFKDLNLLLKYKSIIKHYHPDIVLLYSIKPNVYGGYCCKRAKIPYIANITGLGTALENKGLLQKIAIYMHRISLKNANTIFVQNEENYKFFVKNKINATSLILIPGSGVNTDSFNYIPYPDNSEKHFLFIARIMKEKGIEQFLEAAEYFSRNQNDVFFHVLGFCEENYKQKLENFESKGIIQYHGLVNDVKQYYKMCCCLIHPSYYPEGLSNVLLEACSSGRPVITTNRSGCREVVEDGKNGYIFECKDSKDLICKINKFLSLSIENQKEMGINSRKKVTKEFSRKIVIDNYIDRINDILKKN